MTRRSRKRLTAGILVGVLCLFGIGLYLILGASFRVDFDSRGGQYIAGVDASPRSPRDLTDPDRFVPILPGFRFTGWMAHGQYITNTRQLNSRTTLTANWVPEEFNLHFFVEGVNTHSLSITHGTTFQNLTGTNWVLGDSLHNPFMTFRGWEFHDLSGNRVTLDFRASDATWWLTPFERNDITGEWEASADAAMISPLNEFRPELYDNTFHAMLEYRPVALEFLHGPGNLSPPVTSTLDLSPSPNQWRDLVFTDQINLIGFGGQASEQFLGWRLELPGQSPLFQVDSATGLLTSIQRNYGIDDPARIRDLGILNNLLSRVFSERELVTLDPLLYFVSDGPRELTNANMQRVNFRILRFVPVFNDNAETRFFLRMENDDGSTFLVPITENSHIDGIAAHIDLSANEIVFSQPAARQGRTFVRFQYFDGGGHVVPIYLAQITRISIPALPAVSATIFDMVWRGVTIQVRFDYGSIEHGDRLMFINDINFTGPGNNVPIDREDVPDYFEGFAGQQMFLPSVAMFAIANMTFSHWEDPAGNILGSAGMSYVITSEFGTPYWLTAIWVDNRSNFSFNLNGGRPGPNFNPDPSTMRGAPGTTVTIQTGTPIRFGYEFIGWLVGGTRMYQPGAQIVVAQHRQILVAQWRAQTVHVHLDYSLEVTPGNVQEGRITIPTQFDQSIRLRTISVAEGDPFAEEFNRAVHLAGWRFEDRLNAINPVHRIAGTAETILVNEAFATRHTGDLYDNVMMSEGIIATDIKEGHRRSVDIWSEMGNATVNNPAFIFHNEQWQGPISGEVTPGEFSFSLSRARIMELMTGAQTPTNFTQQLISHDLIGFIYMSERRAGEELNRPDNWGWNADNGGYGHGWMEPYRRLFGVDEIARFEAPIEDMRIYLLWRPRVIEIEVVARNINGQVYDVPVLETYQGDTRPHTFVTNTDPTIGGFALHEFTLNTGRFAVGPQERFSRWNATFIYTNATHGINETRTGLIIPNHTVPHVNHLFHHAQPLTINGLTFYVSRIILTRVVQDLNSFIISVYDMAHHESRRYFGVVENPASPFFYNSDDMGSRFRPILDSSGNIDFRIGQVAGQVDNTPGIPGLQVDPILREAAARAANRVTHYVDEEGNIFDLNMPIVLSNTMTRGHRDGNGNTWSHGYMNADAQGFIILFPVFEQIRFNVIINFEVDASITPGFSDPASVAQDGTLYRQVELPNSWLPSQWFPQFQPALNVMLNTPGFATGGAADPLWTNIRNARHGYFIDMDGVPNIGFRQNGVITPQFHLNQNRHYGLAPFSDDNHIDFRMSSGPEFDVIHLWIHWSPRMIEVEYWFFLGQREVNGQMQPNYTSHRIVGGLFGQPFELANINQFGRLTLGGGILIDQDIRRLGFNIRGWSIDANSGFNNPTFGLGVNVIAGDPGADPSQFGIIPIELLDRNPFNERLMSLSLHVFMEGTTIDNVQFLLMDREEPQANTRTRYIPLDQADNRFANNPNTNGVFSYQAVSAPDVNWNITTENRYVLNLGTVQFGQRIYLDNRETRFNHQRFQSVSGGSYDWVDSDKIFDYWYYHHFDGSIDRVRIFTDSASGGRYFYLDDENLLIDDPTDPARHGRFRDSMLVIYSHFSRITHRLFEFNERVGTTGSISRLQQGEARFIKDLIETDLYANYGFDFIIDSGVFESFSPPEIFDGTEYQFWYNDRVTGLDLYATFIYNEDDPYGILINGQPIDNRFIRFGYELIGFRATTNDGVLGDPSTVQTRDFLSRSRAGAGFEYFNHTYLIQNLNTRVRPVVLEPIWRPMNITLVFDENVMNHDPSLSGMLGNFRDRINVPFESTVNLPLLTTPIDNPLWHVAYEWSYSWPFPESGSINNRIRWQEFYGHLVAPPRSFFDNFFNQNMLYDENNPLSWPRIYFRPDWDSGTILTVNFWLGFETGTGTDIRRITHNNGRNYQRFALKPTIDPTNNYRYLTTHDPDSNRDRIDAHFRLPERDEFNNYLVSQGLHLYGLTTRGWFHSTHFLPNQRLGGEGENYVFIDRLLPAYWDAQSDGMNGFIADMYLRYDWARGEIRFDSNGGLTTPPSRHNVVQNQEVLFDQNEMSVLRRGHVLTGWRFAGHWLPLRDGLGNLILDGNGDPIFGIVEYDGYPHHLNQIYSDTEPFTVQFAPSGVGSNNEPVWFDGGIIVMQAVWDILRVRVHFYNDDPTPRRYTEEPWQNIYVVYDTEYLDPIANNDFVNVARPRKDGWNFVGWYLSPSHEVASRIVPGIGTPGAVDYIEGTLVTSRVEHAVFARFVMNSFRFRFDFNEEPQNVWGMLPENRPGPSEPAFEYNTFIDNLLPRNHNPATGNPMFGHADGSRPFIGWSLDPMSRANLLDPELTQRVLLGNRTAFVPSAWGDNFFEIDVARASEMATYVQHPDGSRTYEIILYAMWLTHSIVVTYIAEHWDSTTPPVDAAVGGPLQQFGYLFVGGDRHAIGGLHADTVGWRSNNPGMVQAWNPFAPLMPTDMRTFGLMTFNDTAFRKPGHNFVGWLPVTTRLTNPLNPLGAFPAGHSLGRMFFPGEFLPSVQESFHMLAQWAPWSENAFVADGQGGWTFDDARLEPVESGISGTLSPGQHGFRYYLRGQTILSIPGEGSAMFSPDFFLNRSTPLETSANVIAFPRGFSVLPRHSIIANNATHINLPTGLLPLSPGVAPENGLEIEARAIISSSLEWLYINDTLVGVDLDMRNASGNRLPVEAYNPERTVYNIVGAPVHRVSGAYISDTNFVAYVVRQGVLELELLPNIGGTPTQNVAINNGRGGLHMFANQTQKYRFDEFTQAWGVLYSRTHDNQRNLIPDAQRTLIAYPSARIPSTLNSFGGTMPNSVANIEMQGVATVRSYAFMNTLNVQEVMMTHDVTISPLTRIERHAFYHTTTSHIRVPNTADLSLHNAFISGYNPFLARVGFGTGGSNISPHAYVADGILYFGNGVTNARGHIIYVLATAGNMSMTHFTLGGNNVLDVNRYALYNVTRMPLHGLALMAAIRLDTVPGVYHEHFMSDLPNTLNWVRTSTNIRTLDWRVLSHLYLTGGLTIEEINAGDPMVTIRNIPGAFVSFSAGGVLPGATPLPGPDMFPIFVARYDLAREYQRVTGMPLVTLNSRFQTFEKRITYNRGLTDNSGLATGANNNIEIPLNNQNLFYSMTHEILARPLQFQYPRYAFMGWKLELDGGRDPIIFQPGHTYEIGMFHIPQTMIYIQHHITLVAQWEEVLVNFIGRHESAPNVFVEYDLIDLNIQLADANDDRTGQTVWPWEMPMAVPGTRLFLPGSRHYFIDEVGNRWQFVGWSQTPRGSTTQSWSWTHTPEADRFFPNGSAGTVVELIDRNNILTFYALYDRASTNIQYLNNGFEGGFTAVRDRNRNFDTFKGATPGISIPAAVMDATNFDWMRPVTQIGERGFWYPLAGNGNNLLTGEIYLGENVSHIAPQAFEMTNATTLTFARNLVPIAEQGRLTNLSIANNAFAYNYLLQSVVIPSSTVFIGARAFLENFAMTSATMGHGTPRLREIRESAFEGNRTMTQLFVIPSTVRVIGMFAFALIAIQNFETENVLGGTITYFDVGTEAPVSAGGRAYVAIDGHLVMHNRGSAYWRLDAYAPGRQTAAFNVGSLRGAGHAVTRIWHGAFAHHRHLVDVTVPHDVMAMDAAFAFARRLETIRMGVGISNGANFQVNNFQENVGLYNAFRNVPPVRILLPDGAPIQAWRNTYGLPVATYFFFASSVNP